MGEEYRKGNTEVKKKGSSWPETLSLIYFSLNMLVRSASNCRVEALHKNKLQISWHCWPVRYSLNSMSMPYTVGMLHV